MKKVVPINAHLVPENANLIFEGEIFDVYQWPQKMFDGSTETFEMLKRPDTASVITVKNDSLIILRQTQPDILKPFLGFPGGRANKNETPLKAAKREVLEETGMTFNSWKLLNVIQPIKKIEWFIYTYLAYDFEKQTHTNHDPGENIEILSMSFEEVVNTAEKVRGDLDSIAGYNNLKDLLNAKEFRGKEIIREYQQVK